MRILLVTRHLPFPPSNGAAQRTNLIFRALSEHADVDTLFLSSQEEQLKEASTCKLVATLQIRHRDIQPYPWLSDICPPAAKVRLACSHRYGFHASPRLVVEAHSLIKRHKYDLIVARYLTSFSQCGLSDCGNVIVDIDDLPSQTFQTEMVDKERNRIMKLIRQVQLRRIVRYQSLLVNQCKHAWLPNPEQIKQFSNASWLPNIPYPFFSAACKNEPLTVTSSKTVLFVGFMGYKPNQDAMSFYVGQVWPMVIKKIPDAELRIVGGGLSMELKARFEQEPGVRALGYVEDLAAEYRNCAFAVAPIFSGGGTNIKVLEAMSHRCPCLLSRCAAKGFDSIIQPSETALIASTPEDFFQKTISLLNDNGLRQKIGEAGHRAIQQSYSFKAVRDEVDRTIKTVMAR